MDRAARGVEGEAATLRLTVDGYPLAATGQALSEAGRAEVLRQRHGKLARVEPAEETMNGGLVWRDARGEAEGAQRGEVLAGTPLGDRLYREVVGEDRRDGEGEDRGPGEANSLSPAGVGGGGESSEGRAGGDHESSGSRRGGCR